MHEFHLIFYTIAYYLGRWSLLSFPSTRELHSYGVKNLCLDVISFQGSIIPKMCNAKGKIKWGIWLPNVVFLKTSFGCTNVPSLFRAQKWCYHEAAEKNIKPIPKSLNVKYFNLYHHYHSIAETCFSSFECFIPFLSTNVLLVDCLFWFLSGFFL